MERNETFDGTARAIFGDAFTVLSDGDLTVGELCDRLMAAASGERDLRVILSGPEDSVIDFHSAMPLGDHAILITFV